MSRFFQDPPQLQNAITETPLFTQWLSWASKGELKADELGFKEFGDRVINVYHPLSLMAENNHPEHIPYEPWGRRIDEIKVHPAWDQMHGMVAEDGIVAAGYERKYEEFSRVYQMIRLAVLHPSSAFVTCPLAMTDGSARVLEIFAPDYVDQKIFKALISRDPKTFYTAGQWMTERTGGSDVSTLETIAQHIDGKEYGLFGTKWFTSAVTGQVTMALARVMEGDVDKGISLFCMKIRDEQGSLNHIHVNRLKDKLGTKALPTAELNLEGSRAHLIGEIGHGVKSISSVLNITRIYNSACSVGTLQRAVSLARDYAKKRRAFGKEIRDHGLHIKQLSRIQVVLEAQIHLLLKTAHLLGLEETGKATEQDLYMLRLLTPILKLWTAKVAVQSASEICESFGGAGYIEDTEIPRLLRDSQVFPIWEGTTNILSLDVLRVMKKEGGFEPLISYVRSHCENMDSKSKEQILDRLTAVMKYVEKALSESPESLQTGARELAFSLGQIVAACSMGCFVKSDFGRSERNQIVLKQFLEMIPREFELDTRDRIQENAKVFFEV